MRKLLRSILALSLCLVLVACDSLAERADKHFQSALALIEEGDYERAELEFRNVFQLDGLHHDARAAYGKMLVDIGKPGRANAQYLRLAEQYPEDIEARVALTNLAMDRQDWPEITRHGNRLRELDPTAPAAEVAGLAMRFSTAIEEKDTAAQARIAAEAGQRIKDLPDFAILRFIIIQQAMNDGNAETALSELDMLLLQKPDRIELHMMRLQLLNTLGRKINVETDLKDLIAQFPEQDDLLPLLLQFYGNEGRPEDAIAYLRDFVAGTPENTQALNTLIELVGQISGGQAALDEIGRLRTSGENEVLLVTQKGRIQYEMGNRSQAIATIEALLAESGDSENIHTAKVVLARMLLGNGNAVGARRLVEEVIAADAVNVAAMKMQANWLIIDDKPDEAVTVLRTAIDVSPDDWEAMMLMADAFTRSGSHELARDFVSLAVETSNNAQAPALRFANILITEERLLLAEETLVNALRQQPDSIELLATLGRVQVIRQDWPRVEQIEATLRTANTDAANRIATGLEVARLAAQSRLDEAMSTLEALGESDGSVQTVAALVRARLSSGDVDGALDYARQSADRKPDDIRLKLIWASAELAAGNLDAGRVMMNELIAANDQIESAWTTLLRLETATGTLETRDALLDRALTAMPNSVALLWARASILTESGKIEEAITIYESIYERSSASLVIANNLATLLANVRDDTESIDRAYAVARRLRGSEVPAFQDTYGWIAFRRGEVEEAQEYLESAAKSLPNEPSVQYHLGMVYLAQDRKPDALSRFLAASQPGNNEAQFPEVGLARAQAAELAAEGVVPAEE